MARHPSEDDEDTPRPRWLAWVIGVLAVCIALGMANLAWLMLTGRLGPTVEKSAPAPASVQGAGAPSAVATLPVMPAAAGSCMRCHGVERTYVGPALVSIAERYRDRADAQAYLAGKIVNGSVGEWGRVIMPRQVGITDAAARELAAWILQLPPSAAGAQSRQQQRPSGSTAPQ